MDQETIDVMKKLLEGSYEPHCTDADMACDKWPISAFSNSENPDAARQELFKKYTRVSTNTLDSAKMLSWVLGQGLQKVIDDKLIGLTNLWLWLAALL